jgi:hypothetical protein
MGSFAVALRTKTRYEQARLALSGTPAIRDCRSAILTVQNVVCLENIQDVLLDDAFLNHLPGSQRVRHSFQRAAGGNELGADGAIQQRGLNHQEGRDDAGAARI